MSEDWSPKTEIDGLQDYLSEANLPPQILGKLNQIAAESLLEYYVIDKRRFELDEIKKGMDAVSLATVPTTRCNKLHQSLFHVPLKRLLMSSA